jgi:hypothetical protein
MGFRALVEIRAIQGYVSKIDFAQPKTSATHVTSEVSNIDAMASTATILWIATLTTVLVTPAVRILSALLRSLHSQTSVKV